VTVFEGMCAEARVLLAVEIVQEARRRAIVDQLDGILVGLIRAGADPDIIAGRLRRLADQIDTPGGARDV
jgi:hypothetical protein